MGQSAGTDRAWCIKEASHGICDLE